MYCVKNISSKDRARVITMAPRRTERLGEPDKRDISRSLRVLFSQKYLPFFWFTPSHSPRPSDHFVRAQSYCTYITVAAVVVTAHAQRSLTSSKNKRFWIAWRHEYYCTRSSDTGTWRRSCSAARSANTNRTPSSSSSGQSIFGRDERPVRHDLYDHADGTETP